MAICALSASFSTSGIVLRGAGIYCPSDGVGVQPAGRGRAHRVTGTSSELQHGEKVGRNGQERPISCEHHYSRRPPAQQLPNSSPRPAREAGAAVTAGQPSCTCRVVRLAVNPLSAILPPTSCGQFCPWDLPWEFAAVGNTMEK